MNWHAVIDERSLEMHCVVAQELQADPAKLDRVVAWVERFLGACQGTTSETEFVVIAQNTGGAVGWCLDPHGLARAPRPDPQRPTAGGRPRHPHFPGAPPQAWAE